MACSGRLHRSGALVSVAARAQQAEVDDSASITRWIADRVGSARLGRADLVEVPLAFAAAGWGCTCPPSYVGSGAAMSEGSAWVEPRFEVPVPEAGRAGAVRLVRGHFTGNVRRFEGDGPERYLVSELVVTELVRQRAPEGARARVVQRAALACSSAVRDETPLAVRARPSARADMLGELTDGTGVTIAEVRATWLRITAPAAGWVYAPNVATSCIPAPGTPE